MRTVKRFAWHPVRLTQSGRWIWLRWYWTGNYLSE